MLHQRGIIITDQEFWFITEEHVGAYQLLLFSEELGISAHYNLLQRVLLTQQFWFIIKSNEYYRLLHSISLSLILENGYWNLYFYLLQINLWLLYFFLCGATAPLGPRPKPNTFRHTHPVGLLWMSDQLVTKPAAYKTHTPNTIHAYSCPQRESKLRSQLSSEFRRMPETARSAGKAVTSDIRG